MLAPASQPAASPLPHGPLRVVGRRRRPSPAATSSSCVGRAAQWQGTKAHDNIATGDRIVDWPSLHRRVCRGPQRLHAAAEHTRFAGGRESTTVKVLRLLTGAVASVGARAQTGKSLTHPHWRASGAPGVCWCPPQQALRGDFCNCYGTVDLAAGSESWSANRCTTSPSGLSPLRAMAGC